MWPFSVYRVNKDTPVIPGSMIVCHICTYVPFIMSIVLHVNTRRLTAFSTHTFILPHIIVIFAGFDDLSPEELRLEAYVAQKSGNIQSYVRNHCLYNYTIKLFSLLQNFSHFFSKTKYIS